MTAVFSVIFVESKRQENTIEKNILSLNRCECKAVSDTIHAPFHTWKVSSCLACDCNDAAVVNCEESCKAVVADYARTGCGKLLKGSKVKYMYDASDCKSGYGSEVFTCA